MNVSCLARWSPSSGCCCAPTLNSRGLARTFHDFKRSCHSPCVQLYVTAPEYKLVRMLRARGIDGTFASDQPPSFHSQGELTVAYRSLRDFIAALERAGELVRVREPVSTVLEMTEIQTAIGLSIYFAYGTRHAARSKWKVANEP